MGVVKDLTLPGRAWTLRRAYRGALACVLLFTGTQELFAQSFNSLAIPNLSSQNTWIIKLKDNHATQKGFLQTQGFKLRKQSQFKRIKSRVRKNKRSLLLENAGMVIAENLSNEELRLLGTDPDVQYIEKNILWKTQDAGADYEQPTHVSQNPWIQDVLGFRASMGDTTTQSEQSNNVIVAVIDTGASVSHPFLLPALQGNAAEINGKPGVDDDGNGYVDDTYGTNSISKKGDASELFTSHGTHVSGLVKVIRDHALAQHPEAKKVSILPVRFIGDEGQGSTAAAIAALEYAAGRGAKVINASWGAEGVENFSNALYETFVRLYEQDIVFAVAAGNSMGARNDNDVNPVFPANFNVPSIISVASVTPTYSSSSASEPSSVELSSFSNYGAQSVDVAAPGDYFNTGSSQAGVLSAYSGHGSWGNLYVRKQGTSMASPLVAGIAGVIRAINPSLRAHDVKEIIIQSARSSQALNGFVRGSGIVHAEAAFQAAARTRASANPQVPGNPIKAGVLEDDANELSSGNGGCGSIASSASGGPFSGNSLGILSLLWACIALSKELRRRRWAPISPRLS